MTEPRNDNEIQTHHNVKTANVLIVDSDPELARFLLESLARKGICGTVANNKKEAFSFLEKDIYDLAFIREKINPQSKMTDKARCGFEMLEKIKSDFPEMPVVMISKEQQVKKTNCRQTVESAVKAVRNGCCEFLARPLERSAVENLLDTFIPNHDVSTIASANRGCRTLYRIVGRSAQMAQTVNLAKKIAPTSIPVLVAGESGTGKELISFLIYHNSKRAQGPYIRVNCAALSESLLESELFGHEKGAFTGAYTQRIGRFEMAHGGTLLLDEITETPAKFQAKLLRVIEQQDFERVGGNENIRVNVRIISTTNKDLAGEVEAGRFRRDLYYRLSGARLVISPLRDRPQDLPELIWHFVNIYSHQVQRKITRLDPAMMDIFSKYHWPGNVRQLRNVVLISLSLGSGQTLSLADVSWLFDELQPLTQKVEAPGDCLVSNNRAVDLNLPGTLAGLPLRQIEQRAIIETLRQTAGNQSKAARVLGISDRTLRDKIRKYQQQDSLQFS